MGPVALIALVMLLPFGAAAVAFAVVWFVRFNREWRRHDAEIKKRNAELDRRILAGCRRSIELLERMGRRA